MTRPKQQRTTNKVLPRAGLNGFNWAFVQSSTFVLRLNFGAKSRRLHKAAKPLCTIVKRHNSDKLQEKNCKFVFNSGT
jgi:hypothetical protein